MRNTPTLIGAEMEITMSVGGLSITAVSQHAKVEEHEWKGRANRGEEYQTPVRL